MFTLTQQVLQIRLRVLGLAIAAIVITSCAACGGGGSGGGDSGGGNASAAPVQLSAQPGVALVLNTSRTTGVAPLAVSFDAIGTTGINTSLPFHEIRYTWNFGDPAGGATWAYGTRPGVASKNLASGPVAAHVFETPGIYTVTLTGFDGAASYSKTTTVTVTDPNTVFATNTLYISQSAVPVPGSGGVPLGANVQQVTNWNTIGTLAQTHKRILLKRGDTWSTNGTATFNTNSPGAGIIGAYGTGNKPKVSVDVNSTAFRFDAGANDWRVIDVEITSNDIVYKNDADGVIAVANNILVLRTSISLGRILISTIGNGNSGLYIVDSVLGPNSTLGYGICGYTDKTDKIAILGNRITGSKDHGFRIQGTANSVVSNNQIDTPLPSGHVFTMRGKTNNANYAVWTGTWTENNVISDNLIDGSMGSAAALKVGPQNNVTAERLRNIIVERNIIKAYNVATTTLSVANDLSFRNNIMVTKGNFGMEVVGDSTVGSPFPSTAYIYNNIFYKPDTSLTNGFSAAYLQGTMTGIAFKNNLAYGPGNTRNGGGSGSTASFIVPYNGNMLNVNYTLQNNSSDMQAHSVRPWAVNSPLNAVDFIPGSGSYAVGAGVVSKVWDDFLGNLSLLPKSIGALNP